MHPHAPTLSHSAWLDAIKPAARVAQPDLRQADPDAAAKAYRAAIAGAPDQANAKAAASWHAGQAALAEGERDQLAQFLKHRAQERAAHAAAGSANHYPVGRSI